MQLQRYATKQRHALFVLYLVGDNLSKKISAFLRTGWFVTGTTRSWCFHRNIRPVGGVDNSTTLEFLLHIVPCFCNPFISCLVIVLKSVVHLSFDAVCKIVLRIPSKDRPRKYDLFNLSYKVIKHV